jgi:hypothetical protein
MEKDTSQLERLTANIRSFTPKSPDSAVSEIFKDVAGLNPSNEDCRALIGSINSLLGTITDGRRRAQFISIRNSFRDELTGLALQRARS